MVKLALLLPVILACGGKDGGPDASLMPRCQTPVSGTNVQMRLVAKIPSSAILVTAPPGDPRLFIIQQNGIIHIMENEVVRATPFIDLSLDSGGPVICCSENGLLGLAFHPQYAVNGTFFVTYTADLDDDVDPPNKQRNVLTRCQVSPTDPNIADRTTCKDVLSINDQFTNHNGGMIEFGSDGFLYWATGDGGSGGDPNLNAQAVNDGVPLANTHALLGKMLRLDVDNKSPGLEYGIPADNPFAAGGGRPEIFMIGLRNAWRWTFDRANGDMWIGDVGQGTIEELDVLHPAQQNGANLGWNTYEGSQCFHAPCGTGTIFPQDERTHNGDGWASITGGQVYRGACFPDIVGTYFYTDYVHGGLATATLNPDDTLTIRDLPGTFPGKVSSLHEDSSGELYETDTSGNIFQLQIVP